jgi:hypothetical protein
LRNNFLGKNRVLRKRVGGEHGLLRKDGVLTKVGFFSKREWGRLGWGRGEGSGLFAFGQLGCGHRNADLWVRVVAHGGEGAEKEAGDVAEDSGATGRDDVGSQENVETPQGIVDSFSVLEVASAMEELEAEVTGPVRLRLEVTRTEHASRVDNPGATLATGGREVEAAMVAGSWLYGFGLHYLSLIWGWGVPTPGVFAEGNYPLTSSKAFCRMWLRGWYGET